MTISDQNNEPCGIGSYPEYHALWHLAACGVVTDLDTFESPAWDAAMMAEPVVIALIDTSVAWRHPNLQGAIDTALMLDFAVAPLGAHPVAAADLAPEDAARRAAVMAALADRPDDPEAQALIAHLRTGAPGASAVSPAFSGHGTAMAGLLAARPARGCRLSAAAGRRRGPSRASTG